MVQVDITRKQHRQWFPGYSSNSTNCDCISQPATQPELPCVNHPTLSHLTSHATRTGEDEMVR
ncbi:hypothetical protein E2C01_025655 [Portunus trituberculatus]|uniref:Uncharacterized protein n=1 Tax=Portunus trituberculatus TaxID=210409 RepID=A0A5B7EG30_PORTR|nr:hypothetical protein [Portunus trituberculatus]